LENAIDSFGIQTEDVSDYGVFVTMAQPAMSVVPLLMDARASFNVVEGIPLDDCSDPGDIDPPDLPPDPTEPGQYETDFSDDEVGEVPEGWSTLWADSDWSVQDDPRRLVHQSGSSDRKALVWDEIGDDGQVYGDAEVFTL